MPVVRSASRSNRTVAMNLRSALAVIATVAAALVLEHPVGATAEPPSPATGHAEVIAQGIVTFDDGPAHWQLTEIPATETESEVDTTSPSFIMAAGPHAVAMSDPTGPIARLAAGEAAFRAAGETTLLRALSGVGGTATATSVVAGAGDPAVTFTPGPGARDVDLVRDVLSANEVLLLHTDVSAFLAVTAGTITAGGTTLETGSTAMLAGDLTLINSSPEMAIVTVAVVGPSLSDSGTPAPVTEPPEPAPAVDAAAPPQSPTPTNPPATTITTTTTTAPADPDTDGDGLTDSEEADDGTDINKPDTDGDQLNDAEEQQHGTDPLDSDTDNDELADGYEINTAGSDPRRPDTDGDGLQDNVENGITRTDPRIPDTDNDGDGLWSTFEGAIGTNPNNPDSDGDQMSDGYEQNHSFSDPLNTDTDSDGVPDNVDHESCNANGADRDGDGLSDAEELNEYHTNCRLADTDGNGQNDPL
jgi:hypothetical protein